MLEEDCASTNYHPNHHSNHHYTYYHYQSDYYCTNNYYYTNNYYTDHNSRGMLFPFISAFISTGHRLGQVQHVPLSPKSTFI